MVDSLGLSNAFVEVAVWRVGLSMVRRGGLYKYIHINIGIQIVADTLT